ncbi:MAG: hypothetical protein AB1505_23115, partial [Candidatus Latescibacterota bacterium]
MTSRQRVLAALRCQQPDRVPYCELGIDRALSHRLMGWPVPATQAASLESNPYSAPEALAIADHLCLDNLCYVLRAPVYAERIPGQDGRLFYGQGQIRTRADLGRLVLPDPEGVTLYAGAREFVAQKGERAAWFVTRVGIFPTTLSMGLEAFSLALFEDPGFVEEVLDRYCDWTANVARRVCS